MSKAILIGATVLIIIAFVMGSNAGHTSTVNEGKSSQLDSMLSKYASIKQVYNEFIASGGTNAAYEKAVGKMDKNYLDQLSGKISTAVMTAYVAEPHAVDEVLTGAFYSLKNKLELTYVIALLNLGFQKTKGTDFVTVLITNISDSTLAKIYDKLKNLPLV